GRCYVSDGSTHLIDFTARPFGEGGKPVEVGTRGSELKLPEASKLQFTVKAAVRRPGGGKVAVELVVNGSPVAKEEIEADGKLRDINFETRVAKSSWATVRVFPSGHSNPIFLIVDDKPIRASRASANWCLKGVDLCWESKKGTYTDKEKKDAEEAYEHA